MSSHVLLYWPNIVGYIRISLLFAAWGFHDTPSVFVPLYSANILLDWVDGWLARRLKQVSNFGAWLDVVVDNLSRGMLWSLVSQCGWLVSAVEWCVFVCNHCSKGDDWKNSFSHSPKLVQAIMANGFRTPLGLLVVSGLDVLPLWLYCSQRGLLAPSLWAQDGVTALLIAGRALALVAEAWCVWTHMKFLTKDEPKES
uniref:Si:ch1073-145m9.1 n=1 Tax=Neogobius melanostomus TaxID=47308 RepID=A0A8C6SY24_9GOBI